MKCPFCKAPEMESVDGVQPGSGWKVLHIIAIKGGELRCLKCRRVWDPMKPIPQANRDLREPDPEANHES